MAEEPAAYRGGHAFEEPQQQRRALVAPRRADVAAREASTDEVRVCVGVLVRRDVAGRDGIARQVAGLTRIELPAVDPGLLLEPCQTIGEPGLGNGVADIEQVRGIVPPGHDVGLAVGPADVVEELPLGVHGVLEAIEH